MHPSRDDSLNLAQLSSHYASGRWSVAAVIDAVMERIASSPDKAIFIDIFPPELIAAQVDRLANCEAKPADLPLFGVPFAVKDNIDVAGRPTTAACHAFAYTPDVSAMVVRKLCDAGAIVVGKTNLDQFATGLVGVRSLYGVCVNPFDGNYIVGGSSSGSAAAVARGLVSFALGTDTAGSGRVPAAFTNTVGFKPSRGLISASGVVPACRSLDCVSIFSLTCEDAWKVAQTAMGLDSTDAYSRGQEELPPCPDGNPQFRFGIPAPAQLQFFGNNEYASLFDRSVQRMVSLGGVPILVDLQPFLDAGRLLYDGPWVAERLGGLKTFWDQHRQEMLPVIQEILAAGLGYDSMGCFDGMHNLAACRQRAGAAWREIDLLLLPTAGTIYTIAQVAEDTIGLNKNLGRYTSFANLMDLCCIAVPAGFGGDGLPMGVSLLAPAGREAQLLPIAAALHRAADVKLGATGCPMPPVAESEFIQEERIQLAVVGAHLSGQPLNGQLTSRGGKLVKACRTGRSYRLYALAGTVPPKPGLMKVTADAGAAIEVEVWALSPEAFGNFVAAVPPPMVIGTIELEDGSQVKGFLCEPYVIAGAREITGFGGWRAFLNVRG